MVGEGVDVGTTEEEIRTDVCEGKTVKVEL